MRSLGVRVALREIEKASLIMITREETHPKVESARRIERGREGEDTVKGLL